MFRILFVILKKKKYAIIVFIVAVIMTALSYYLTVKGVFNKSIFIYAEMNGSLFTALSLFLSITIAVFFGLYVSLLIFRRDIIKKRAAGDKITGFGGAGAGILASGCPTCGAPLLGLIGFPIGLFSLPFKGLELKVLAVGFLFLSVFLISKNIKKNLVCNTGV